MYLRSGERWRIGQIIEITHAEGKFCLLAPLVHWLSVLAWVGFVSATNVDIYSDTIFMIK